MSTSSIEYAEGPVWITPENLPEDSSQFRATLDALTAKGTLTGSPEELKDLFGHSKPTLHSKLDLFHGLLREKRAADSMRTYLAKSFTETVQMFSVAEQLAKQRARIGAAFLRLTNPSSANNLKNAKFMSPEEDEVAPEAATTRIISTVVSTEPSLRLEIEPKKTKDSIILPSSEDLGFEGFTKFTAQAAPTAATVAKHSQEVALRQHLYAGHETAVGATEIPLGSLLGGCGMNSIVEIPEYVINNLLHRILTEEELAPDIMPLPVFSGEGSELMNNSALLDKQQVYA